MKKANVVCISGSLRSHSNSQAILNSVIELLPANTSAWQLSIGDYPLYNVDEEQALVPHSVQNDRDRISASDAVIIVTAEYNHGIPGALKNALDWYSRPVHQSCMKDKPVFFITQSSGALGGVRAQHHLRENLASMLCILPPLAEITVTHVETKISNSRLVDSASLSFISHQLNEFLLITQPVMHV
ncbi:NAD(P)H-dependent oxidoreductase [Vibrio fluvialis]|uniref:NADPH-dependent FMN reductase n=1 Tax=Vibrio fluvialis TaxID=676 RepID=UPI00215D2C10|nr:NAD(P)H-dependent oxidoreductase [Vibrio fluvialis]MCR9298242.1 NAD(P)H-dependent oxidoreductase [Vibrio fluvialis]